MKTTLSAIVSSGVVAVFAAAAPLQASAQAKGEIRIAHVYSKTGPLEAYGKQTQTGLLMGLDYATQRHHDGRRQASWW